MLKDYIFNKFDECVRENIDDNGSLIGLPYPYTVPSVADRFQEMYYWDTYFANKKEYDYAYQNPDKYSVIRQIAKYDKYTTYKNEITDIRNNTSNE